ncbi:MAG: hypothetical protein E7315_03815 [Clostridiales bacterium]|nr:hypothetical protein [Clostridiales bacterium]
MDRFEAIFERHSVRSYDFTELSPGILEDIKNSALNADTLGLSGGLELNYLNNTDKIAQKHLFKGIIGQYGCVTAPYYLHCRASQSAYADIYTGICLESAVLDCTRFGIGTCWIGIPLNNEYINGVLGESFDTTNQVMLALGLPDKALTQQTYKRKDIGDIIKGDASPEAIRLIEAARIAPSSMNSQPWVFTVDGDRIILSVKKRGASRLSQTLTHLNRIDAGIALCHISVAAEHYSMELSYTLLDNDNGEIMAIDIL